MIGTPFDAAARRALLGANATRYLEVALANIEREYPHMPAFVAEGPADYRTHRELHPAFYGCFDWHSCVEMHWAIVRTLRLVPGLPASEIERARLTLDRLLTPSNLAAEVAFFARPANRGLERPYGWGWLFTLASELRAWHDPDARRWADAVEPLARLLADRLADWLPKLTYPQRVGMHANTAFGLTRALDFAAPHDPRLAAAIDAAVERLFGADTDCPAGWEPSGADFLSPALCEAELVSRLRDPGPFEAWLSAFLPGLAAGAPASLFTPAHVSDTSDGQLAHLHGLNLSRAWAFVALAGRLTADDARRDLLLAAAGRHADAALPHVAGSDYMAEHWLAAYAVLLLGHGQTPA